MRSVEREDLAPSVHALFRSVQRAMPIKEPVTRAVVAVEFIRLAMSLQLILMQVYLLRARRSVVIPKKAEEWTRECPGQVDRGNRGLVVELVLTHHDPPAPELDTCVYIGPLAGVDERMATARAGAEEPDHAILARLRPHPLHRCRRISDDLRVRNAAIGTDLRRHIVGIGLRRNARKGWHRSPDSRCGQIGGLPRCRIHSSPADDG